MVDMIQVQGMPSKEFVHRGYREVAQVLVINGVELAVLDQVANIRRFDDCHTIILEQNANAFDEAVEIGYVGEHIVSNDHVGALALCAQLLCETLGEERTQGGDADFLCGSRRPLGGINPQHRNTALHEVSQQIPIIARQFDNQARSIQSPRFS